MVARRILRSVTLGLLAVAGAAFPYAGFAQARSAPVHSAQAFRHYTNARARYSISYPARWEVLANNGVDLFVGAPDHHAFLSANATAVGGPVTAAQIRQQQKVVLVGQHAGANTIRYAVRRIHGVTYQVAEGHVKQGNRYVDVILVDTLHRGYIFDFNAGVLLKARSTAAETKLLQDSLSSITLKP
jgi:hypothetical protein